MKVAKAIYESLQENLSVPELRLEDLVLHGCGYRHYLYLQQAERNPPLSGPAIMLREGYFGIRQMIANYMADCYGDDFEPGQVLALDGVVLCDLIGTINGCFVEVIPVSTNDFAIGRVPRRSRILAATKAYITGCSEAWVVLIDRDKQAWGSWFLTGDFESVAKEVLGDVEFVAGLVTGEKLDGGLASDQTCSRCPYEDVCTAPRLGDPQPFSDRGLVIDESPKLCLELDQYLWKLNERKSDREEGVFHPSEFSTSKCDRRLAYGLLSEKRKTRIDPQTRRVFDVGHVYHDVVQSALEWISEDFEAEVGLRHGELRIAGHCDGVEERLGYEIKTIGSKGFVKLTSPKKDHRDQAGLYAGMGDLELMRYIYVNKETADLAVYEVPPNRKAWHNAAARATSIIKTVDAEELPPKVEGKDYLCRKCDYGWKCRPELFRHETTKKRSFRR